MVKSSLSAKSSTALKRRPANLGTSMRWVVVRVSQPLRASRARHLTQITRVQVQGTVEVPQYQKDQATGKLYI